jgi:hypothetical protein
VSLGRFSACRFLSAVAEVYMSTVRPAAEEAGRDEASRGKES